MLISAATWATSAILPGTYSASSDVLVASRSTLASVDAVNGTNDLATQYAQFASTGVVLSDAAQRAAVPPAELSKGTVVSTVANTNIVRVTVTARSPSAASRGAIAVAEALVAQVQALIVGPQEAVPVQVKELDELLSRARDDVAQLTESLSQTRPGTARAIVLTTSLNNAQQRVLALTLKRVDLVNEASGDQGGPQVSLSLLTPEPAAHKVAPRPLMYATVGFVVALLIMTELAVVSERRRHPDYRGRRFRSTLAG